MQRRGDPSPHRAQGRILPKVALEATSSAPRQDFLESQEVRSRQDFLESQEVRSRQDFLESQEVRSRQDFLEPGSPLQTGLPKVHDGHVYNDHPPTTRDGGGGGKEDDLDRTLKRLIKACQVFGAIQGLTPSDLDKVRAKLIDTGRQLTGEDCAYIAEETLRALPREAWRTPERIKGMLNKKMADLIQGVHIDAEQAYKILGRLA